MPGANYDFFIFFFQSNVMSYSAKNIRILKNIEIHSFQWEKNKNQNPQNTRRHTWKQPWKLNIHHRNASISMVKKKCYSTLLWIGNWIENEIDDADVIFRLYNLLIQL